MNKKNIDHIFHNKLSGKETPPSLQAWKKLEKNLNNKRKTILLYRFAAAIAILIISSLVIWNINTDKLLSVGITLKDQEKQELKIVQDLNPAMQAEIPLEKSNGENESENLTAAIDPEVEEKEIIAKPQEKISTVSKENQLDNQKEQPKLTPVYSNDISSEIALTNEEIIIEFKDEAPETLKENIIYPKVTITFVRGASGDNKEIALSDNSKEPADQESKIRRLLQSAKELKLSDVNLAEIRETKDEFFNLKPKL